MPQIPEILFPIIALVLGLAVGSFAMYLMSRSSTERAKRQARSEGEIKIAQLSERVSRVPLLEAELAEKSKLLLQETRNAAAVTQQASRLPQIEADLQRAASERDQLKIQLAECLANLKSEEEKLVFREQEKQQMSHAFQTLANDILEQKTLRFTEHNKNNIDQILTPLKTKIAEFQEQIRVMSAEDNNGRSAMGEQVRQLTSLNQQLSEDAKNLTSALKGSSKTQGNWGEMILERMLEASGLQRGREYELRESYQRDDGHRGQPDVVINLPEGRHLIIDAKVSLTDYEACANAADDSDRQNAAARHVQSMRRHMKDLSEKNYTQLHGLKTLDFVVMFVPIEPAFAAAINTDQGLWEAGLKKNVLLVSPSALLFVLRTVTVLWRQEEQARNVKDIARRGGELYTKLAGFVEALDKVGVRIRQAQESFDEAHRKLKTGPGSVIRQAEMLKRLGIRPSKSLPQGMVEEAMQETLPEVAAFVDLEESREAGLGETREELPDHKNTVLQRAG